MAQVASGLQRVASSITGSVTPNPMPTPSEPPQQMMQQQQQQQAFAPCTPSRRGGRGRHRTPVPKSLSVLPKGRAKDASHTVIAMVVDTSSSMSSMGDEVQGGCNAYLDEQRASDVEDGTHSTVVLVTFDSNVTVVHGGKPLVEMAPISKDDVRPDGMTALYDGIGQALATTTELVAGLPADPNVTVFILTDGHENSSQVWNKASIAREIKRLQDEHGFDFYFAAANQDAMTTGQALSVDTAQCVTFSPQAQGSRQAFVSASKAQIRGKRGMSKAFTPAERTSCMTPDVQNLK